MHTHTVTQVKLETLTLVKHWELGEQLGFSANEKPSSSDRSL